MNGENHVITAKVYQNMGSYNIQHGNYEKAFYFFEKSMKIKTILFGELSG